VTKTLPVHINRDGLHSIEAADASFEVTGTFSVALKNDGAPVHVHLHLDDELSETATLEANNHFVEGELRMVAVTVEEGRRPVQGKLKVVTGYGVNTEYVDVSVVEPEATARHVPVDEGLAVPQPEPAPEPPLQQRIRENAPLTLLGGFALLLAVGAALLAGTAAVLIGVLAVVAGVAAAGYLLVR